MPRLHQLGGPVGRSINLHKTDIKSFKLTRCGQACRGRSGCILDNLNQMPHALKKSLANHLGASRSNRH